jgi:prevent-host-death family protein
MDKYITATEANQKLSSVLRDVAAGATYTITSRGKPVAEISAPKKKTRAKKAKRLDDLWACMDKLPGIVTGPYSRDDVYDRNW